MSKTHTSTPQTIATAQATTQSYAWTNNIADQIRAENGAKHTPDEDNGETVETYVKITKLTQSGSRRQ